MGDELEGEEGEHVESATMERSLLTVIVVESNSELGQQAWLAVTSMSRRYLSRL
jgi:hypothetical protein